MSQNNRIESLDRLRERREAARARRDIARAEAEAQLLETSLIDPFDSGANWSNSWIPITTGGDRTAHVGGHNRPFIWSEIDLSLMRSQARWIATKNPLGIGALRSLSHFTIRTGYVYEVEPAKNLKQDRMVEEVVRQVQYVVDQFCDLNQWPVRERSVFRRSVRDGEVFVRHFPQRDGTVLVRFVEPEQLVQPPGAGPEWSFGIRTDPQDIETVLDYYVTYSGDPSDAERIDVGEISHLKRNVDECVKRGLSDFYSTGDSFDGTLKLIRNMRETGSVQASIAWIEQFDGATAQSVRDQIAASRDLNRNYETDPITGKSVNYKKFEPGTITKVGKGRTYVPAPMATSATQHISIVQACLRALGVRWNMPEYLISGDASNANYSSTLVSGSPFVLSIETEQDDYRRFFLRCLWIAIRHACFCGRVRANGHPVSFESVQRIVDVKATPPQVAIANKDEEARIDSQDIKDGVMSVQERRRRRGLDDSQMRREIAEESPVRSQLFCGKPLVPAASGVQESLYERLSHLREQYGSTLASEIAGAVRRLWESIEFVDSPWKK